MSGGEAAGMRGGEAAGLIRGLRREIAPRRGHGLELGGTSPFFRRMALGTPLC
jgi:hypothetical protein